MANERNYGIDLLRLVFMYMVCILHTLGQGGVLGASEAGTVHYHLYWLFEILSYCAVDGFAIISGYVATDKPPKYSKIVDMWFQPFFYSFVVTVIFTWLKFDTITPITSDRIVMYLKPLTSNAFWFFSAYFVLFFAAPWLYRGLSAMSDHAAKIALILLVVPFSLTEALTGIFRTTAGYSAIWLMVVFCVGVLAKKVRLFESKKTWVLWLLLAVCAAITWYNLMFGDGKLTDYTSPTVLCEGLLLVIIFSRLRPNPKIVGFLSPLALGVYFFQTNYAIWGNWLYGTCSFIGRMATVQGTLWIFGIATVIFLSGLIVELLRSTTAKLIRLPKLSELIVRGLEFVFSKIALLLK